MQSLFNGSSTVVVVMKIDGVPKDYNKMPSGRQIEYRHVIEEFKAKAKSVWLSQKHRSYRTAIAEAKKLYNAKQYYCRFNNAPYYWDHSFEFFYLEQ